MEGLTYNIRIKKEYASELIADLLEVNAIEIVEDSILEWQKKETLRRLELTKANPERVLAENEFWKNLNSNDQKL